jgi:hypothetical protein
MSRKTKTVVTWQSVGSQNDLVSLANAVREAAFRDSRGADYDLYLFRPEYSFFSKPTKLTVEIRGSVSARDLVAEVKAGEHGAW